MILPFDPDVIPQGGTYWIFHRPGRSPSATELEQLVAVTCGFELGRTHIYAVARTPDHLPESITDCHLESDAGQD